MAHREIDLAHPDSNRNSAGFTDEEREGFYKPSKKRLYRYISII